ncbi:MAG: beta-ketoacyl synthase N-terminal-like domain-containing protein [Rikenellaceae bacterium]
MGRDTQENYLGVHSYTTNISKYKDNTPVCLIDRLLLNIVGLEQYTFAEQLSITALSDVIQQSRVKIDDERTLLIISTTKGNIECLNSDTHMCYLWSMSDKIADYFHCKNKPIIVSNACISGVAAIVMGARFIEAGQYDNVYILGVDVISEFVVSGFNSFKSISPTICHPYDQSRDGLTLGEGCAALLLSADNDISKSKIVVSGGGMSDDANHISGPSRTGDGLSLAINTALTQSGLSPNQIGFVNAHGTGTPFNDEMESKALNISLLADVPCNSLKPYFGHTLGASGVIETILSIEQLRNNHIFGVKGYTKSGVPFNLNVSAEHRDMEVDHCIKTASGFGGTNVAVILSKESAREQKQTSKNKANIIEIAHIEIDKDTNVPFAEYIRSEYKALSDSNLKFFKMDDLCKLGYVASCKLLKGIDLPYSAGRIGIVLANRSSSLNTDINHQSIVDQHLPEGASPAVFVYTLANIVAAEIAIKHKFQGELSMFISENKNINFISEYSKLLISNGLCDAVLYGWCELLHDEYQADLKLIKIE